MSDAELQLSLRAYGRRRPFRPFLLEFTSGAQVIVHHPEAVGPASTLWHYRGPQNAQALFASSSVCRLLDLPAGP